MKTNKTRMPRRETERWKILGKHLDRVRMGIDAAISRGFVGADGAYLANELSNIIIAAKSAREEIVVKDSVNAGKERP